MIALNPHVYTPIFFIKKIEKNAWVYNCPLNYRWTVPCPGEYPESTPRCPSPPSAIGCSAVGGGRSSRVLRYPDATTRGTILLCSQAVWWWILQHHLGWVRQGLTDCQTPCNATLPLITLLAFCYSLTQEHTLSDFYSLTHALLRWTQRFYWQWYMSSKWPKLYLHARWTCSLLTVLYLEKQSRSRRKRIHRSRERCRRRSIVVNLDQSRGCCTGWSAHPVDMGTEN